MASVLMSADHKVLRRPTRSLTAPCRSATAPYGPTPALHSLHHHRLGIDPGTKARPSALHDGPNILDNLDPATRSALRNSSNTRE
jgi:hypothetical protein